MNKTLKTDIGLLIFRVGVAFLMLYAHGFSKIMLLFSGEEIQFVDPIGLGVTFSFILVALAEFVCSLLIVIGLGTRWAALALTIAMGVATFVQHFGQDFADASKQMASLFFLSFLLISFLGAGRISIDAVIKKK